MATLHVRNVPDDLYDRLKALAEEDHRSLSAEVIWLLGEAASPSPSSSQPRRQAVVEGGLLAERTPAGIAALGPQHFGFDLDFVPLEERIRPV